MTLKNKCFTFLTILLSIFLLHSCNSSQSILSTINKGIQPLKLSGGSSGMEQLGDQSYLVVYDIKNYKVGTRMAVIKITDEAINVSPMNITGWDEEGRSSDLESICKIPGRTNEYFIAESGNWKGDIGRIFHIKVDTANLSAKVIGTTKLPYKDINNGELTGDQYESMTCFPYSENERILMICERGGSKINPKGIVRWGKYNLTSHTLNLSEQGMQGITVNAPGDFADNNTNRDITDLHIDEDGNIWASASDDVGDLGPFYSVIYKIGKLDPTNKERPFHIFDSFTTWKPISGFKIESLSGPSKNIDCTHSFGTEDENYGGVWRPISIK